MGRGWEGTLEKSLSPLHDAPMKSLASLIACLSLALSACIAPTIDQELTRKCGVSVDKLRQAEAILDASDNGKSVRAGRCRFTRTKDGAYEVS